MNQQSPLAFALDSPFLRYVAVGLINTALGLAVFTVLYHSVGLEPLVANAVSFLIGMICSFALNRRLTFRSSGRAAAQFPRFVATVAIGFAVNAAVLLAATDVLGMPVMAAQLAAMASYTIITYVLSKSFVFTGPDNG